MHVAGRHDMDLFEQSDVDLAQQPKCPKFGIYQAQPHPQGKGYVITVPQGELVYIPQFIPQKIADRTMDVLLANDRYDWRSIDWHSIENIQSIGWTNVPWKQDEIRMFGKTHDLPRLTAWFGDEGKNYTYSGIVSYPAPWNKALLWLKQQLSLVVDADFNSALLNWYRNGQDNLSWHDDAEPELGKNPVIASMNFGESRRFLLRRKDDHQHKIEILLGHGDLLIMSGELQEYWQHSVPKQAKIKGSRINITFRYIFT